MDETRPPLLENKIKPNKYITIYTVHELNETSTGRSLLHRLTNLFSWKSDYADLLFSFFCSMTHWFHAISDWIVPISVPIFKKFHSYLDSKETSFQVLNVTCQT